MKSFFTNGLIFSLSIIVSLVLCEVMLRTVLDPIDYLLPKIVKDPLLNHKVDPNTGGHDGWGFRNAKRLERSDIVAIGDSMTYGVSADSKHSWPALLANELKEPVYNMSLGGYGPVHYFSLLKDKAIQLKPKTAIIGFYFGNDLMDSYNIVHSNENWKHLGRQEQEQKQKLDAGNFVPALKKIKRPFGDLRNWFSRNSVLYRIVTRLKLFDFIRHREFSAKAKNGIVLEVNNIPLLFNPAQRLRVTKLDDPRVLEGLEISKSAFLDIKALAEKNGIRLIILLIPTKERVYFDQLETASMALPDSTMARLFEYETRIHKMLVSFFNLNNIEFIDLLPPLAAAAQKDAIYPFNDGHPNAKGYSVIAREIYAKALKRD